MRLLLSILLVYTIGFSHSGRTDSSGGHYNRSTGEYHYHNSGYKKTSYTNNKASSSDYQCGNKRYCYEMVSCKEVMFYFNNCGLSRLDGDKDGIPCEKLCR